ncbi:MAG: aminoacyl-tRNA hydrolase [Bacteroidetes bacterium HGW-Bacteroidetes-21]|jgi:ribosome-associated protein|nr:MAG: aminoacyl-tRNA hydrolase [Bacteroidetes bacterium HGW-Bacteroidetes-21]
MLKDGRDLLRFLVFVTSRSSGPGGQNVNKVNTRVELRFNVHACELLTDAEKMLISEKLKRKINSYGEFILVRQTERSQLKNKEKCLLAFYELINQALIPPKKRKKTKLSVAVKVRRSEEKKRAAMKKKDRGWSKNSGLEGE